MFSGQICRRMLTTSWIAAAALALAVPALAQTGRIQGKVTDEKDAAVQGAQILVTAIPDQGGQKWQATTDKNGNYIIGTLPKSGQYLVVANKEGVGSDENRACCENRQLHDVEFQALSACPGQRGAGGRRMRKSRNSSRKASLPLRPAIIRQRSRRSTTRP